LIAKYLLRYLNGTIYIGLVYGGSGINLAYSIWTDATWGTKDDRKSFQGYVIIKVERAISWAITRQKNISQNIIEAEIVIANKGAKKAA
jgi:hypothetical protein